MRRLARLLPTMVIAIGVIAAPAARADESTCSAAEEWDGEHCVAMQLPEEHIGGAVCPELTDVLQPDGSCGPPVVAAPTIVTPPAPAPAPTPPIIVTPPAAVAPPMAVTPSAAPTPPAVTPDGTAALVAIIREFIRAILGALFRVTP